MIMKYKSKSPDSLRINIAALAVMQASNYILPLIALPYLARVLGVENFGQVVLIQAFMMYFILLVEYGFTWSATRKISAYRHDPDILGKIFINVWVAQWLIVFICFISFCFILVSVEYVRLKADFYILAFLSVLGSVLLPMWFLQGVEKMRVVAILQFFGKIFGLIFMFGFVKNDSDIKQAILASSLPTIFIGFFSLFYIYKNKFFFLRAPSWAGIFDELREGWSIFTSRLYISAYSIMLPLILGWMAGPSALACYNVADKLRSGAQSLINPIVQALFPRISFLMEKQDKSVIDLLKKSAVAIFFVSAIASFLLWFFAENLIDLIAGNKFEGAVAVLRWMSPIPLFVGVSNLLGVQVMLPLKMNFEFNRAFFFAALLCLMGMWPMIKLAAAEGAAMTLLAVEFLGCALISFYLWRNGFFKKLLFHK